MTSSGDNVTAATGATVAPTSAQSLKDQIGIETAKYLESRAGESFKRELGVEEGIWRSLPLFTGLLLAAVALLAQAIGRLPPLETSTYSITAHILLTLSSVLFGVSGWWLWQIVRARDFEYPSTDVSIADYATDITKFHSASLSDEASVDAAVVHDLRVYTSRQLAEVAGSHFYNNQARLSARSQVVVFLLAGFVLAIGCDALTYGHDLWYKTEVGAESDERGRSIEAPALPPSGCIPASGASTSPDRQRRRMVEQAQSRSAGKKQVDGGER